MKKQICIAASISTIAFMAGCNPTGLSVEVIGSGQVTSEDGTIDCPTTCSRSASATDEVITLHAVPAAGFKFDGWGGSCSGQEEICVANATNAAPTHLTANFVRLVQTVDQIHFRDDFLHLCVTSNYSPTADIESVTELNCVDATVRDLSGVQYLTNLRALRINGPNEIADISPLTLLPNFSVLSLYGASEKLVHVQALAGIESFNELYIENAPLLVYADIEAIRRKVGSENVIIGGHCAE